MSRSSAACPHGGHYQADYRLQLAINSRLDAIHAGVKSQKTGELAEDYDRKAIGPRTNLCRLAWREMSRYRLTSGRMM